MLGRRQFMKGVAVGAGLLTATTKPAVAAPTAPGGYALTADALEDALVGSSYLGCGGGGSLAAARALIREDLAAGRGFHLLKTADLADDDRVACPYALASLAPMSADMEARLRAQDQAEPPTLAAFRLLERHLRTRFRAVVLGEIGPLSMAEGLSIAARLGVPALDADTVGRATPEINQHSVRVAGHALTPAAGVTPFGDEIILENLRDPNREEEIFRTLSVISREVGVVDAPISGAVAKSGDTLVRGSFSLARRIGAAVRAARLSSADPIEAARQAGNGYTLFEGRVQGFRWADQDGFLVGTLRVTGEGPDQGTVLDLAYKNEHLVARRDGHVVATCPDLITVVDATTHEGVNNPDFEEGQTVRVLGFRSAPLWRTKAGLAVFEPRYFGYDLDYVPIEQRVSGAS